MFLKRKRAVAAGAVLALLFLAAIWTPLLATSAPLHFRGADKGAITQAARVARLELKDLARAFDGKESWNRGKAEASFAVVEFQLARMERSLSEGVAAKVRAVRDDVARHEEFRKGALDVLVVDHNAWDDRLSKDPTITGIANHYTYDHIGLLVPSIRTSAGYRGYTDADIERLHLVLVYRSVGMPLEEIRGLLDDPNADALEHLRRQHELLLEQAERLAHLLAEAN